MKKEQIIAMWLFAISQAILPTPSRGRLIAKRDALSALQSAQAQEIRKREKEQGNKPREVCGTRPPGTSIFCETKPPKKRHSTDSITPYENVEPHKGGRVKRALLRTVAALKEESRNQREYLDFLKKM